MNLKEARINLENFGRDILPTMFPGIVMEEQQHRLVESITPGDWFIDLDETHIWIKIGMYRPEVEVVEKFSEKIGARLREFTVEGAEVIAEGDTITFKVPYTC